MEKSAWFASLAASLTMAVGLLVVSWRYLNSHHRSPRRDGGRGRNATGPRTQAGGSGRPSRRASMRRSKARGAAPPHRTGSSTPRPATTFLSPRSSGSRNGWKLIKARPRGRAAARGRRSDPTYGVNLFNQFRDRSVYNSGTQNFAGRTIAAEIDPSCVAGDCRLWIGNANGGVWMTDDALAAEPAWRFISHTFEHQNVAALALDPNDPQSNTLWAGHGRAQRVRQRLHGRRRALSHDQRRQVVEGPHRRGAVRRPRRRIDRRAAGQLERDLCRVGPRRARRLEHMLRRRRRAHPGRAALRPLSIDERRLELGARQPGRAGAVHGVDAGSGLAEPDAVLAARRAPRDVRPGGSEHGVRRRSSRAASGDRGISATPGSRSWRPSGRSARRSGPSSTSSNCRMEKPGCTSAWVVARLQSCPSPPTAQFARFRRNDAVRNPAGGAVAASVDRPHQQQRRSQPSRAFPASATATPSARYDNYVYVPPGAGPDTSICWATTSTTRTTTSRGAPTGAPSCCRPTPACTSPT